MAGPELVGNALCLDFANTVNTRPVPNRDWIAEPADLDDWARYLGLGGRRAESVDEVHKLREAVYRTFSMVATARRPPQTDLDVITATYAQAVEAARLVPADTAYRLDRSRSGAGNTAYGPDRRRPGADNAAYALDWRRPTIDQHVRWAVADSATDLLRRGPLERIGECPSCGWLFLDTSRNGRRRWCSMATCGNRVKSARHYAGRPERTVNRRGTTPILGLQPPQ